MKETGAVEDGDYREKDFKVDRLTVEQLIDSGLIKVHILNETYEKIIDGDE